MNLKAMKSAVIKWLLKNATSFLGRRYYAHLIIVVGTGEVELASKVFATRREADEHRKVIDATLTFKVLDTVSVWLREPDVRLL